MIPLVLLPAMHQSGVNCLAVATAGALSKREDSRSVILITGGDDGALRATLLSVSVSSIDGKQRPEVSVSASATVKGAHSACALRGAWVGEIEIENHGSGKRSKAEVVTAGLDQRLRGWAVSMEEKRSRISSIRLAPALVVRARAGPGAGVSRGATRERSGLGLRERDAGVFLEVKNKKRKKLEKRKNIENERFLVELFPFVLSF